MNVKMTFDDNSQKWNIKSDEELMDCVRHALEKIPPFYDNLELTGEMDGHHFVIRHVKNWIARNLTDDEFDDLMCIDMESLTNRIGD